MKGCCSVFLVVSLLARVAKGGEPAGPSALELAERLRQIGSFSECAVEALREAYAQPAEREAGFDRAALCLSQAGRFEDARRLMLALEAGNPPLGHQGRLRLCLTEVFMSALEAPRCPAVAPSRPTHALDARANHTLVMRAVLSRRWGEGRALLAREAAGPPDAKLVRWQVEDRAFLERQASLPRKSAWIAGGLSAVVPGLGRVYVGRWPDGLFSFLVIGVVSGFAAHGFYEDGRTSVRGWILGSTAALLHVGNIYGSAVGALVQRRETEDTLMKEIERDYRRRLEP
jgi:hypothetical protein